jgi:hypothetical protein
MILRPIRDLLLNLPSASLVINRNSVSPRWESLFSKIIYKESLASLRRIIGIRILWAPPQAWNVIMTPSPTLPLKRGRVHSDLAGLQTSECTWPKVSKCICNLNWGGTAQVTGAIWMWYERLQAVLQILRSQYRSGQATGACAFHDPHPSLKRYHNVSDIKSHHMYADLMRDLWMPQAHAYFLTLSKAWSEILTPTQAWSTIKVHQAHACFKRNKPVLPLKRGGCLNMD